MKKIMIALLVVLMLLLPTGAVWAAARLTTTVAAGETVNNDVVLFEDDLEVEEGGTINGNVTLFQGSATIAGTVNGDLVLFNGDLATRETAVINGNCVLLNGTLRDETDGRVGCTRVGSLPNFIPALSNLPGFRSAAEPAAGPAGTSRPFLDFVVNTFGALLSGLLMAGLAFVTASLLPNHLGQVQATLRAKPLVSGGVGLLTAVAVPSLIVLLSLISGLLLLVCIGILGFGVVLALILVLVAALLFGWIAVGTLVGHWIAHRLGRQWGPSLTAALGTLLMTFTINFLGGIPFVRGEGLLSLLIFCVGLGAVALTLFGMRAYPPESELDVVIYEDEVKVTAVLETLPGDELNGLKKRP